MKRRAPSPEHVMEMRWRERRRFERARDELGAGNMNDTKWHEVVAVLEAYKWKRDALRAKCVGADNVADLRFVRHVNSDWVDTFVGPIQYHEIEWLDIRHDQAAEIRRLLANLGRLPIIETDDGFRVVAYGRLIP